MTSASFVPRSLDRGARWAWRFLVVAAAIYVVVWLVVRLRVVMIPVFVAFILAALFSPAVDLVARRMPRILATWAVLLLTLALLVGGGFLLAQPVVDAVGDVGSEFEVAIDDLRDWLETGPLGLEESRVDSIFDSIGSSGDGLVAGVTERPGTTARLLAEVIGGIFLALVLTFFMLKEGRSMWAWFVGLLAPARRVEVDLAGRAAFRSVQGWIRGVAITGVVDGLLIGVALLLLGVPAAIPLAVITMFAAFFPIVGATVAGALAVLVALAAEGATTALIVGAVVLVVQQVEGDVLLPIVMRRQVSLHPIVVLLALGIGGVLAGLVGALVAVPLTAAGAAAVRAVHDHRQPDEPDAPEGETDAALGTGDTDAGDDDRERALEASR